MTTRTSSSAVSVPTAARVRPTWPELPVVVRSAIEARTGPVRGWTSHDGGYSPGLASTLRTDDGPVFVKAVSVEHEFSAHLYRQEAERIVRLPEAVPALRLRWFQEIPATPDGGLAHGWVALAFDTLECRTPGLPWDDAELQAVLDLAVEIGRHEVPAGALPEFSAELVADKARLLADERPQGLDTYDPWLARHLDRLAAIEADAPAAVAGSALLHGDLRGDNALLVSDPERRGRGHGRLRALAVDWAYATRGAAFCDLVCLLPATQVEGGPGPEEVLRRRPLPPGTDDDAVTALLVALAGYFVHSSLQPPPPGIPHVRAFQRAQGEACVAWLRRRLRA